MDMKRDYYEDVQLFKSKVMLVWSVLFLVALAVFPLVGGNYYSYLLNFGIFIPSDVPPEPELFLTQCNTWPPSVYREEE